VGQVWPLWRPWRVFFRTWVLQIHRTVLESTLYSLPVLSGTRELTKLSLSLPVKGEGVCEI
jgi:hypothetical protein